MQQNEDFSKSIRKLGKRFNRKITEDLLDIYYDVVQRIPNKVFYDIVKHFIERSKTFPIPGDFLDQWYEWQRSHPEFMVKENEPQHCDVCGGSGVIEIEQIPKFIRDNPKFQDEENPLRLAYKEAVCRCGHCANKGASKDIPRMTLDQIAESKWKRLYDKDAIIIKKPIKDMKKLTNRALKNMPNEIDVIARKQELMRQYLVSKEKERQVEIYDDDVPF